MRPSGPILTKTEEEETRLAAEQTSTRRRVTLVVAMLVAVVVGAVATLPSCGGPPDKTCFADRVHALGSADDAGPNRACTTCLQSKSAPRACCDAVGACDDDPDKQCIPSFRAAHECVIDGGASEESRCKGLLANDKSKNLYACMRSNCGPECGVPSCDLDPAVILLANPACDSCIGNACCEKINACYKSRRCKLIIECITTRCTETLGSSMTALGRARPDLRTAANKALCDGQDPPADPAPDRCIQQCLDDFAPQGDAGTTDDQSARCLAFDVYACGAEANCGPKCARSDAGPYSGSGTPAEDDASSAD